jgi:hypothetical protein
MAPVNLPPLCDLVVPPTGIELFCLRIRVVGWAIAHLMKQSRTRPAMERVRGQLLDRSAPTDLWGEDLGRREFAYFVSRTIAREAEWPNDYFIPDDPLDTLCFASLVHRADAAVALSIGDRLNRRVTSVEWARLLQLTLGELVDLLLPGVGRVCPDCEYSLVGIASERCPECGEATTWLEE